MNFFGHLCHIIFMKKTKGGGGKIMSTWCVTKCMEPHYSRQFIRSKATKTPLWWSNLLGAFQFPVFPVTSQNMTTKHALYFSCQKIECNFLSNLFWISENCKPLIRGLATVIILSVSEWLSNNALLKPSHRIPDGVDGYGNQWNTTILSKLQF